MDSGTAVTGLRFTQMAPDRGYLVRVVPIGGYWSLHTLASDFASFQGTTPKADILLRLLSAGLSALAVERVWMVKCPENGCYGGRVLVKGHPGEWSQGPQSSKPCPHCASSPRPGWVVEVCPERWSAARGDGPHDERCNRCHGTGEHVERMGLVEATRKLVGYFPGTDHQYGLAADALALLAEGAE